MRRWLIASGDFTTLGGMDRANHALARHLAAHGRDVHLVAHRVAADLRAMPGVTVHDVGRPLGAHLAGAPLLSRTASSVARQLGPGTCTLVNGGNTALAASTWIHYLHAAYTPVVAGSLRSRTSASAGRRYHLRGERRAVTRAPLAICNSHRTVADLTSAYGPSLPRTAVVYYGSDPEAFAPASEPERQAARAALGLSWEKRLALFVGALGDRRKGFDALFEAWTELTRDPAWDVDLAVAGAGGELAAWRSRSRASGLGTRMHYLGFRPDISAVLAAADVLVHPARYEAYGLGVHEALCCEVPSIVTANAGIAERYPETLGGLVLPPRPTPHQIASALRAWRDEQDCFRDRVRPLARELRARSWDDMAADIVRLVEDAG
jgi:glycosyltransferase involved in cell wall biosynthesis